MTTREEDQGQPPMCLTMDALSSTLACYIIYLLWKAYFLFFFVKLLMNLQTNTDFLHYDQTDRSMDKRVHKVIWTMGKMTEDLQCDLTYFTASLWQKLLNRLLMILMFFHHGKQGWCVLFMFYQGDYIWWLDKFSETLVWSREKEYEVLFLGLVFLLESWTLLFLSPAFLHHHLFFHIFLSGPKFF